MAPADNGEPVMTMIKQFEVSANDVALGVYEATCEQAARDACAIDAGYTSEADMVERLERPSDLVAVEVENLENHD